MCAIAGIVAQQSERPNVEILSQAQHHRGPDAGGVWSDGVCTLGHQRLAIIDLSDAGRQPLSNEDGTIWITFNGEIYNFPSLRRELTDLGHRFRTRTDTEVIVHAYEQWGTECVKRLRGMFAFGLWNQRQQQLLLARDRVGKKPLFYTQAGDRFLFASELQGLLADPQIPRATNYEAIDAYLTYGYIPAPHTAFRQLFKLPPAHWLTLDWNGGKPTMRTERYWSLAYTPKLNLDEDEAREMLRAKLTEAVRLRLRSDVPLGAFLSGGMDSSVVVGLMAQLSGARVKTFSIGFEAAAYDETAHARRIAKKWNTDHHEFIVRPTAIEVLPKLVRHFGEPYADSSAVPTFYVSQLTRQHVMVALNGDGGDENFAGYERYLGNQWAERCQAVPGITDVARTFSQWLPEASAAKSRWRSARQFLGVAAAPMAQRYARWVGYFDGAAKPQLYSHEFLEQLNGARDGWLGTLFREVATLDPVDAALAVDVRSYLPFDLLVKTDITSMANSLEARSPFLDHEVMEFAARLPVGLKIRGGPLKYLLKRTFADLLPPENVQRRKMGFGLPLGDWLRGELRALTQETLFSTRAGQRGYFQRAALERLFHDHLAARADHSFRLWNLLMLELWHQEFFS
jgi:asparagine synthase (glutamine-hydrolysing)